MTAPTASAASTASTAAGPCTHVLVCPACQLTGQPFGNPAEVAYLAGIHDQLHHGGNPMAAVSSAVHTVAQTDCDTSVLVPQQGGIQ